jgi:hypothetical protein
MSSYEEFLSKKEFRDEMAGFDADDGILIDTLFPFQKAIVKWALKKGRAAIFADTGLGKTAMQLAWAKAVHQYTGNRVLIVAPLCVSQQTVLEADKFGIGGVKYIREHEVETGIKVTNYEMIENFADGIAAGFYDGIILDESSILKHQTSKTREKIIQITRNIPYRLSCTATPSPNDHMELGSQSEFLNIMSAAEMLAMFFIHDSGETSKWRLKGHGALKFWQWLSTWAVCIKKPSDLGFSDEGYNLPPLEIKEHVVKTGKRLSERLLDEPAKTLSERIDARRITVDERVQYCAELMKKAEGPFLIWCHLNDESEKLRALLPDAVEVSGSDKISVKEDRIIGFTLGKYRGMITKPKIAGFGMNWQHCSQMAFVGLNDSFEQLYQAVRRCYRFGQKNKVTVHLISADLEGEVLKNLKEKEAKNEHMSQMMVEHMRDFSKREVLSTRNEKLKYIAENKIKFPSWLRGEDELH